MKTKLLIHGSMTDLNLYINANRNSKFQGAQIKKEETERVAWEARIQRLPSFTRKVYIKINIFTKDLRKDEDNLHFAEKFILDGLVKAKILINDSRQYVHVVPEVFYDGKERIEILLSTEPLFQDIP